MGHGRGKVGWKGDQKLCEQRAEKGKRVSSDLTGTREIYRRVGCEWVP